MCPIEVHRFKEGQVGMDPSATPGVDASAPDQAGLAAVLTAEPLGLVISGAHARGVADTLDALGLAAILLDEFGRVLHLTVRAEDLCGAALRPHRARLVSATPDGQVRVDALVARAVSPAPGPERVVFEASSGSEGFEMSVLRFAEAMPDASRRVKAALLVARLPRAAAQ